MTRVVWESSICSAGASGVQHGLHVEGARDWGRGRTREGQQGFGGPESGQGSGSLGVWGGSVSTDV